MAQKYVRVKVFVNARKEEIIDEGNGRFVVRVKEKAERNLANERVCELIASRLNIPRKQVRIISGHTSPQKLLSVYN